MIHNKPGLIFPQGSFKPAVQEQLLLEAGATRIITVNRSWRSLFTGARDVREGDTVLFVALAFVPTARGGDELAPSVQASEFVAELGRVGAVGIEVYTGRSTAKNEERRAMVREASAALRNGSRRPPAGFKKVGRKGIVLTSEQKREWGRIWKSKDYPTNKDALAAMGEPFNNVTATKLFGPSGRPVGPRKRED